MFPRYAALPLSLAAVCIATGLALVLRPLLGTGSWPLALLGLGRSQTEIGCGILFLAAGQAALIPALPPLAKPASRIGHTGKAGTSVQGALRRRVERPLAHEFAGFVGPLAVGRCVTDSAGQLLRSQRRLVLQLVYELARERLEALATVQGVLPKDQLDVLFVCRDNAGLSQMAASLTHVLSAGRMHVHSAGTTPVGRLNPIAAEAMAELGIDLAREFPKPLTDEVLAAADIVITLGCGEACPPCPGKRTLDWPIDDPAGQPLEQVRIVRDRIRHEVERFLRDCGLTPRIR